MKEWKKDGGIQRNEVTKKDGEMEERQRDGGWKKY